MQRTMAEDVNILAKTYGPPEAIEEVLSTGTFEPVNRRERVGEVVAAILRRNGKYIMITKPFYPQGTYRLPSGGIEAEESIEAALRREVYEETSLTIDIIRFIAVIHYRVERSKREFYSHVFLVRETEGELSCVDKDEQISEYREIRVDELPKIIAHLESLSGEYRDYGLFRAAPHKAVLRALRCSLA
jgi:8-oxo-dGTP pyrophosphatase MutT (NUDIX family)